MSFKSTTNNIISDIDGFLGSILNTKKSNEKQQPTKDDKIIYINCCGKDYCVLESTVSHKMF